VETRYGRWPAASPHSAGLPLSAAQVRERERTRRKRIREVAAGLALAVVAKFVVPAIPGIFVKVSLSQAASLCNSGLGQFATAMNHTAAHECARVSNIMQVCNLVALAGLGYAGWYGYLLWRDKGVRA